MLTDEILTDVHAGRVPFSTLANAHRGDFMAIAKRERRRFRDLATVAVDDEDVVQEILLMLSNALFQYDPDRGSDTIAKFVRFRASAAARRVLRRAASMKDVDSRYEPDDNPPAASPEEAMIVRESARNMAAILSKTPAQRVVADSIIATQSLQATTNELLSHPETAAMFSRRNPQFAIYRTVRRLVENAEQLAG